eukprot:scaffold47_cov258-Pinguiococcus_pyrenoidosus.AAC.12
MCATAAWKSTSDIFLGFFSSALKASSHASKQLVSPPRRLISTYGSIVPSSSVLTVSMPSAFPREERPLVALEKDVRAQDTPGRLEPRLQLLVQRVAHLLLLRGHPQAICEAAEHFMRPELQHGISGVVVRRKIRAGPMNATHDSLEVLEGERVLPWRRAAIRRALHLHPPQGLEDLQRCWHNVVQDLAHVHADHGRERQQPRLEQALHRPLFGLRDV